MESEKQRAVIGLSDMTVRRYFKRYIDDHQGGCSRIVFAARSSENFVDKAERGKLPEAQLVLR